MRLLFLLLSAKLEGSVVSRWWNSNAKRRRLGDRIIGARGDVWPGDTAVCTLTPVFFVHSKKKLNNKKNILHSESVSLIYVLQHFVRRNLIHHVGAVTSVFSLLLMKFTQFLDDNVWVYSGSQNIQLIPKDFNDTHCENFFFFTCRNSLQRFRLLGPENKSISVDWSNSLREYLAY